MTASEVRPLLGQKRTIILDAAKVSAASGGNSEPKHVAAVAECEGLLPLKHDAGTATRHYRCILATQMPCRYAAEAVLKPQGGAIVRCCGLNSIPTMMAAAAPAPRTKFAFFRYPNYRKYVV